MALRLAFLGSPDFAVPALEALIGAGHEIACVYSQPPRPAGRGKQERPTPVHAFAAAHGFDVRTPKSLKRIEDQEAFAALRLDAAIVVAYGLILPKAILDAPALGCFNLHASLLPRWRGAAPIQRAIMAGDDTTGVQVMRMEEGLDTGPVLASAETPITPEDNARSLHDRLAAIGARLLAETSLRLAEADAAAQPQDAEGVTYAAKLSQEDARLDWTKPARVLERQVRGLSPAPGAWCLAPGESGPVRLKILEAHIAQGQIAAPGETLDDALLVACGEGALRLALVQREGKGVMAAADFLRGAPLPAGRQLL
jgi:methionyl-tRNA formyltransferase